MATSAVFPDAVDIQGDLTVRGSLLPGVSRSDMVQDSLKPYPIPFTWWRVHDEPHTNLPGTSATDDLGLYGTAFGTNSLSLQTYDVKNLGAVTLYARATIPIPAEYVDGQTVVLRFHAGMLTTIASVSATLDVVAYESDGEAGISADICDTAAITINSVTLADKDFTITPTSLSAGDELDVRIAIAVNDSGTGTAVIGIVGRAVLLVDVKG